MKRTFNPWLLILLIILGIVVANQFNSLSPSKKIDYSSFRSLVEDGKVASIEIEIPSGNIQGKLVNEIQISTDSGMQAIKEFKTIAPANDSNLSNLFYEKIPKVSYKPPSYWPGILLNLLPIIILIGLFWFIFMRAQGGPSQVMQFGQSKARTYGKENKVKTSFDDVAGHKEAKQELLEVVDFLKNPQKYHQIGATIPKGVLLVGPPGTGKTLLARAVAGEAKVPFLTVSASEFMEMFVGVGASRVRSLFEEARKSSPSIIFIDEIDSIGRRRGAGIGGGHDEREQTLNQILSEMDGFEQDTSVIIIAATNRPDILDPALLRPGRFDRQVTVGLPTSSERRDILAVHTRGKPLANDVDLERLAESTPMFSGADLENLSNEAALVAARGGKQIISWSDFNEALDRIILGLRRSSLIPSKEEYRITAYHEAGHAVAFLTQPKLGKLRKVTIMPRGNAGGFVAPLSKETMYSPVERFREQLIFAFGGRVAEKKLTGTISSGASADLRQATSIAKQMVFDLGMGKEEYIAWGSDSGPVFLGGQISQRKDFSEKTANELEEEISSILKEAYDKTTLLIDENWPAVEAVANGLLELETLDGKVIAEGYKKLKEGVYSSEEFTEFIISESKRLAELHSSSPSISPQVDVNDKSSSSDISTSQPPRPATEAS